MRGGGRPGDRRGGSGAPLHGGRLRTCGESADPARPDPRRDRRRRGQALWEACRYDRASGQLLSASFMDYAMPRADQLPMFDTEISEVPAASHPLGMRGGGEGGTTPALAAVANAVLDALVEFGVEHLDMPLTPERVWRAIQR